MDVLGNGQWKTFKTVQVLPGEAVQVSFDPQEKGEWIRVKTAQKTIASAHFTYAQQEKRGEKPDDIFQGLATSGNFNGALLYGLGNNRRAFGSTRVMRTCGMMGEVVGMAAYVAKTHQTNPRDVYEKYLSEFMGMIRD